MEDAEVTGHSLYNWTGFSDRHLREELHAARVRFRANRGNGVEDADFIDGASIELRHRRQARYRQTRKNQIR